MSDFFHFHYNSGGAINESTLEVGDVIKTGVDFNPYFRSVMDYFSSIPHGENQLPILGFLKYGSAFGYPSAIVANACAEIIESHFKLIREYEFERVRSAEFPNLPSRMRCLWMTDKSLISHWNQRLDGRANKRLLRVSAHGKIHRANEGFLPVEVTPMSELQDLARAYWRGEDHEKGKFELLLEGSMEILEMIDTTEHLGR